jgi:hypothetical protein
MLALQLPDTNINQVQGHDSLEMLKRFEPLLSIIITKCTSSSLPRLSNRGRDPVHAPTECRGAPTAAVPISSINPPRVHPTSSGRRAERSIIESHTHTPRPTIDPLATHQKGPSKGFIRKYHACCGRQGVQSFRGDQLTIATTFSPAARSSKFSILSWARPYMARVLQSRLYTM